MAGWKRVGVNKRFAELTLTDRINKAAATTVVNYSSPKQVGASGLQFPLASHVLVFDPTKMCPPSQL